MPYILSHLLSDEISPKDMSGQRNGDGNDDVKRAVYNWTTWKRNADGTMEAPSPVRKKLCTEGSESLNILLSNLEPNSYVS